MTDSTLVMGANSNDFSWFTAEPGASDITVTDADLVNGTRNYIELKLANETNTPLVRAFWDPSANGGAGQEFNQQVDTMEDLRVDYEVLQGGFSGSPDRIPLAIVDTDASGNITIILDRRQLLFRLGDPSDLDQDFSWISQQEPTFSLVLSSVTGSFTTGETMDIGGTETATVVAGGTTNITMRIPSGINFSSGDTITGQSSGATGTLETVSESFSGADKDIDDFREALSAIMTEIKRLKGTRFWYQTQLNSNEGISQFINSQIVQIGTNAKYSWTGTALTLTDDNGSPSDSDVVAKIRLFGQSRDIDLTRQDGSGGSSTIAIADGEVLFVELPDSGDRAYSGTGASNTNFQVDALADYTVSDNNYWLAYREGTKLYVRGYGELEPGESAQIGDPVTQQLLTFIGAVDETDSDPNYSSTDVVTQSSSLVSAISDLDVDLGEVNRVLARLRVEEHASNDSKVTITDSELALLDSSTLSQVIDTFLLDFSGANIDFSSGTVLAGDDSTPLGNNFSPFSIPAGEYFWYGVSIIGDVVNADNEQTGLIQVDPASSSNSTAANAPKAPITGDLKLGLVRVFNNAGTIEVDEIVRFGAGAGSGGGDAVIKATFLDPVSTSLPTGASYTVDGVSISNGETVLFTNLSSNNNRIYEVSGVGSSISWEAKREFGSSLDASDGDSVRILRGDSFQEQLATFDGTDFKVNDVVRFFDGVSANFWELTSIKNSTLTNNSTDNLITVSYAGSENMIISYSITRGTNKETGQLYVTTNGTDANVTRNNSYIGDVGISFDASISGSDLLLDYTADNQGVDGNITYFGQRGSNSPGGPTRIPKYPTTPVSSIGAAGSVGDIQFHGSSGNLDADSRFKWDGAEGALDLDGLSYSVLNGPVTINDNQSVASNLFTYSASSFSFAVIEYSIKRDTNFRTGRILISNSSTNSDFSDDFVELGSTGVSLSVGVASGNVEVRYTSTSTGNTGEFKYTIKKWS